MLKYAIVQFYQAFDQAIHNETAMMEKKRQFLKQRAATR
jgi:hypothetical protein